MSAADRILSKVSAWAHAERNVRGLVLVGSRALEAPDELADIDVQVYAETAEPYTRDDGWLSAISPVWLYVRDEYRQGDIVVPTRLVIFASGVKVDFAFYPAGTVADVIRDSPAYRVLLDKDGVASDDGRESRRWKQQAAPSDADLARAVNEFWFEAYHVAKYLARGELWLAKSRDWATKELLLQVIEWHARAERGWSLETQDGGKHMRKWASDDVWEGLHRAFSHFDADDSWDGLLATTALFRRLATEIAAVLGSAYPVQVDRNISGFIAGLRRSRFPR